MNGHNVTLDCRVVDLDSVTEGAKDQEERIQSDCRSAMGIIRDLISYIDPEEKVINYQHYSNLFSESYKKILVKIPIQK